MLAGGALLIAGLAVVTVGVLLATGHPSLSSDPAALARVGTPFGGGTVERVSAVIAPDSKPVPVTLRGDQIWPNGLIPTHRLVTVAVVVKRPGWISWLTGSTQTERLTVMTPSASLRQHYLTLQSGAPIVLHFREPVQAVSYGPAPGQLHRKVLAQPQSDVTVPRPAQAGTIDVAAAPRSWERSSSSVVSYFPAGSASSAVANPAPGSRITPHTPITLTFSGTVQQALGNSRPPVSPDTPGTWHDINSHTIMFEPDAGDYGYGLGSTVTVALPGGVRLVGGQPAGNSDNATWKVPGGSPLRLQQLLAELGYLPLRYSSPAHIASDPAAQEQAAINPPAGHFTWRYPNVPSTLRGFWSPGASGVMTQGAIMAFENDHGMTTDGIASAPVWKALIRAATSHKTSSFGYTFVMVDKESSPESVTVWHSGKTVVTTPANTGVAASPTASGTFPVFEHLPVTTMSGTNPDGSTYSDPGIQWVSYFNGGDALHAFDRASFGTPQSDGCVEMPLDAAARVYPYTPIGTLVHVA